MSGKRFNEFTFIVFDFVDFFRWCLHANDDLLYIWVGEMWPRSVRGPENIGAHIILLWDLNHFKNFKRYH